MIKPLSHQPLVLFSGPRASGLFSHKRARYHNRVIQYSQAVDVKIVNELTSMAVWLLTVVPVSFRKVNHFTVDYVAHGGNTNRSCPLTK